MVTNGLPLSKIHHTAFDAQLIGIDPDFRIHVTDRLLDLHDGPFIEQGFEGYGRTTNPFASAKGELPRPGAARRPLRAVQEIRLAAAVKSAPGPPMTLGNCGCGTRVAYRVVQGARPPGRA